MSRVEKIWVAVGFAGQALFFSRFLIQWIASERQGRVVIPLAFWWLSLGGAAILTAYAIHRADPVFIAGSAFGMLIYVRNLLLLRRERSAPPSE